MAANTNPVFALTANLGWGTAITTANTAMDGTGTQVTAFTAGADGAVVRGVRVKALGTNVQTVVRIFANNGSSNATAANNALVGELTIPATTASNTTALADFYLPLTLALPAGYKLNAAIGTTVSAGLMVSVDGSNF